MKKFISFAFIITLISGWSVLSAVDRVPAQAQPRVEIPRRIYERWVTHTDSQAGFTIEYPATFQVVSSSPSAAFTVNYPAGYSVGTNLRSAKINVYKYNTLQIPYPEFYLQKQYTTILAENPFIYREGSDSGAGQYGEIVQYLTIPRSNEMYMVELIMLSTNTEAYENAPREFSREQLVSIFNRIVNTFKII